MTVPGNSAVLLILLAALIASTGYAGGRIHQWYRMGRDRDEAYRDGYDTATRSVFSLAARVINPRRAERAAIRASAAVILPPSAVVSSSTAVEAQIPLPRTGSGATRSPAPADHPSPAESVVLPGPARPVVSAAPPGVVDPVRSISRSGSRGPARSATAPAPVPSAAPAGSASPDREADGEPDPVESSGRHLVPDELVRADTYRLAADRVARAKVVHGWASPITSTEADQPPRGAVPKPRGS